MMLFSCENSMTTVNKITIEEDTLATISTYNMIYERSDSGRVQVKLTSKLMKRYGGNDAYSEFPDGFEITFYNKKGDRTSSITANYGISYDNRKYMNARHNVIVKNYETSEELYTENLEWDQKKRLIKSNTFVKLVMPNKIIYGDSMWADEAFSKHEIYNVKGEFEVNDDVDE